jgi:hypothetical protein
LLEQAVLLADDDDPCANSGRWNSADLGNRDGSHDIGLVVLRDFVFFAEVEAPGNGLDFSQRIQSVTEASTLPIWRTYRDLGRDRFLARPSGRLAAK